MDGIGWDVSGPEAKASAYSSTYPRTHAYLGRLHALVDATTASAHVSALVCRLPHPLTTAYFQQTSASTHSPQQTDLHRRQSSSARAWTGLRAAPAGAAYLITFFFFFSPARILFPSTSAAGAVGAAVRKCEYVSAWLPVACPASSLEVSISAHVRSLGWVSYRLAWTHRRCSGRVRNTGSE